MLRLQWKCGVRIGVQNLDMYESMWGKTTLSYFAHMAIPHANTGDQTQDTALETPSSTNSANQTAGLGLETATPLQAMQTLPLSIQGGLSSETDSWRTSAYSFSFH